MDRGLPNPFPDEATAPALGDPLPRRILVGVDEGPATADALALARALARHGDAELIVASIRPYWPESIPPGDYARVVAEEEEKLRREVTPLLGATGFATRVIAGGHAGEGLKEIAAAEQADLIVIASTHRGPIGRVLPGSVGEHVLDGAPCAVAIAPHGQAHRQRALRRVVVACDGSREAAAAVERAAALAEAADASLTLVGVVEMRFDLAGFAKAADFQEIARIERALERARAGLPPWLRVATRQIHGVAADVIAAVAHDADLLVIGSRGNYGRGRRLFLGSVAARLARSAPCATLIVPAT